MSAISAVAFHASADIHARTTFEVWLEPESPKLEPVRLWEYRSLVDARRAVEIASKMQAGKIVIVQETIRREVVE